MKLLSLDLSTSNSGWAVFQDGKLIEYGNIPEPKYKGKSKEVYPQRSGRLGKMMATSICELIIEKTPDKIVIEEACPNGIAGVKSIKSLCMLHGSLLTKMQLLGMGQYDTLEFLSPREWRKVFDLKKNGDWKASSLKLANKMFNLNLTDDDISDSILLGYGFLKLGGYLERKI